MNEWLSQKLMELAVFIPIPWLTYRVIEFAMSLINPGPPVKCIGFQRQFEWQLEYDKKYIEETEALVDKEIQRCKSRK